MSTRFVVPAGLFARSVGVGAWPVDECPRLTEPRVTPRRRGSLPAGLVPAAGCGRRPAGLAPAVDTRCDATGSEVPAPSADPIVEPAAATDAAAERAAAQPVDVAARSDTSARCSSRCS